MGLKDDLSKLHAIQAESFRDSRKRREQEQLYCTNCVRAIETAAAKLGMDPATLAERCANGEIGTLADQSREAHAELTSCIPHGADPCHPTRVRADELSAALRPFKE